MKDWKPGDCAFEPVIHPTARIGSFSTVDAGFDSRTCVGPRVFLMTKTHIGHDAVIGEDSVIAPFGCVGGYARLGKRVKMGMGAIILPFIRVGDDAVIGAGAVVTKDVPEGAVMVGNPARQIEKRAVTTVAEKFKNRSA